MLRAKIFSYLLAGALLVVPTVSCSSGDKQAIDQNSTNSTTQEAEDHSSLEESDDDDDESVAVSTSTSSTPTTSTSTTSSTSTTLPEGCPSSWNDSPKLTAGWPGAVPTGGPSILADAGIGAHSYFDRFVLDFDGSGDASYEVRWVTGRPMADDGAGTPVAISGSQFLFVRVIGSAGWGLDPSDWYSGPTDLDGNAVGAQAILQAKMTSDYEGYVGWHIGTEQISTFNVFTLDSPKRIVVDICHELS